MRRLSKVKASASRQELAETHGLLLNMAKVELWLMGYNVRPTGYNLKSAKIASDTGDGLGLFDVWMKSSDLSQFFQIKRNLKLYGALCKFWQDFGKKEKEASRLSVDFLQRFPAFFQQIDAGIREHDKADDHQRQEEIQKKSGTLPGTSGDDSEQGTKDRQPHLGRCAPRMRVAEKDGEKNYLHRAQPFQADLWHRPSGFYGDQKCLPMLRGRGLVFFHNPF